MKYEEVITDLENRGNNRSEPKLDETVKSLEQLGNPEKNYEIILVGGTNGKGSTAEMISHALQIKGFRVGVFTSPHLTSFRERIRVNQKKITREDLTELYKEVNRLDTDLTFFEFTTVLGYLYFSREEVDYAVVEVGMGGRLDATNAADNSYAVITNIGRDHSDYLGETKEEISEEKAGITPKNGLLITKENFSSITEKASERNTKIVRPIKIEKKGSKYIYNNQEFKIPLNGSFQKENLENAITTVEEVEGEMEKLDKTFKNLKWPGRMDKISENPLYIHDGAHNPAALEKAVKDYPEDFICVFSALKSKNIDKMIEILEEKASKFYLTKSQIKYAEDPNKIALSCPKPSEVVQDPRAAVKKAKKEGKPVVVTGSLYLIGDLRDSR